MNRKDLKKELLSRKTRQSLTRLVARKIGAKEDVEEIVQDVLLNAWTCLSRFKQQSSLFAYLSGIARHEIADFYRKKRIKEIVFSRFPFLEKLVNQALGPELAYQELETKRKILKTLKSLSEGYRQVLRLKYIEELTVKEIALQLKVTAKAVESRLTRARLAFQKVYGKNEYRETKKFFEKVGQDWLATGN